MPSLLLRRAERGTGVLGVSAQRTHCEACKREIEPAFINTLNGEVVGPDPCLGVLPGVLAACCGHGKKQGYIYFENGVTVYFKLQNVISEPVEVVPYEAIV